MTRKKAANGAGTVEWVPPKGDETQGHYKCRLSLRDGTRPWFHMDPGPKSPEAERTALRKAAAWAARMRAGKGIVSVPKDVLDRIAEGKATGGEIVTDWFGRWQQQRRERGLRSSKAAVSLFKNHIEPTIGSLPIALVSRVDVERVRDRLDVMIHRRLAWETKGSPASERVGGRAPGIGAKTAANAWDVLLGIFGAAKSHKQASFRVRTDSPTTDVAPPDDHPQKEGAFLYPSEFLAFVGAAEVPLRWRRMVALAVYLGTRSGEQRAITWGDVDLEHGKIAITKQVSRETGKVVTTKTGGARWPDIEPNLLPLLEAMRREATPKGANGPDKTAAICWMPPEEDQADGFRKWLLVAEVKRAELHTATPTTSAIRFHDTRHTAATWMAARGASVFEIMQRTGHKSIGSVQRYVERFGNVNRASFGQPFPVLPKALLEPPVVRAVVRKGRRSGDSVTVLSGYVATPMGIEPMLPA